MSAPPQTSRITREDLKDAPAWVDTLLQVLNPALDRTSTALTRGLSLADNLNATVVTVDVVGPLNPWTDATLQNSWVKYPDVFAPIGYRIEAPRRVNLRGVVASGTLTAAAFTLPTGYRPEYDVLFGTESNSAHGTGRIKAATGEVIPFAGSNVWFSLDNISFDAASPAAAPARPAGQGWPVLVKHGLNSVSGLQILKSEDLTAGFSATTTISARGVPEWRPGSKSGVLEILAIDGLTAGRKYRLTLLVWG
jgi:hypothetical protein